MSIDRNAMAQSATTPSDRPPSIKWEQPGQEVFGQVTHVEFDKSIEGQKDLAHLAEVNDQQQGPLTVWLTASQLKSGLVEGRNQLGRRIQIGDIIYIRYGGKQKLPNGNDMHTFAINLAPGQQQGNGQAAPAQVPAPQPQQQPVQQAPQQPAQPQQPTPQQQWAGAAQGQPQGNSGAPF